MDPVLSVLQQYNLERCGCTETNRHFRLVTPASVSPGSFLAELRLCSQHPPFITCLVPTSRSRVLLHSSGPSTFRAWYPLTPDGLMEMRARMEQLREDDDPACSGSLAWELEDWVGCGNPCRLVPKDSSRRPLLDEDEPMPFRIDDLSAECLWAVNARPPPPPRRAY